MRGYINRFHNRIMKKYRLKEEVKKYLHVKEYGNLDNTIMTLRKWNQDGLTIEALEEVEERIKVGIEKRQEGLDSKYYPYFLEKNVRGHWTEQERQDIEKFLNVFGTWDAMYNRLSDGCYAWVEQALRNKGYES